LEDIQHQVQSNCLELSLSLCDRGAGPHHRHRRGNRVRRSSLNTVMQMVAGGYGVTPIPRVAANVERRDQWVKFLRLENQQPGRSIGLVFRSTSPRKADFAALGEVVKESVGILPARIASKKRN
jgi:LysR family transcriptional regulator, hydrogen peroxide-inducible genes activator